MRGGAGVCVRLPEGLPIRGRLLLGLIGRSRENGDGDEGEGEDEDESGGGDEGA